MNLYNLILMINFNIQNYKRSLNKCVKLIMNFYLVLKKLIINYKKNNRKQNNYRNKINNNNQIIIK